MGLMGWIMYALGGSKKANPPRKPRKKDNVTFLPIIFEEQEEIRMHNAISCY
jgi:hypothetical protein